MKLYNYFRSSASYRVRIALALKGLAYDYHAVHLTRGGGQQFTPEFRAVNAQGLVPVLVDGPETLTQSLAILEYLEETHPEPPLLPRAPAERARVRALALVIACEVHPLNNLRVLNYLSSRLGMQEGPRTEWYRHWVEQGLGAFEASLAGSPFTGRFCHGDTPGLADCCLIPQLFNARRFGCDLSGYPLALAIERACQELPAFRNAAPEHQPDAET
jgi:maleylpyruvate isomerase